MKNLKKIEFFLNYLKNITSYSIWYSEKESTHKYWITQNFEPIPRRISSLYRYILKLEKNSLKLNSHYLKGIKN
jgi:hypothetical protein